MPRCVCSCVCTMHMCRHVSKKPGTSLHVAWSRQPPQRPPSQCCLAEGSLACWETSREKWGLRSPRATRYVQGDGGLTSSTSSSGVAGARSVLSVVHEVSDKVSESTDSSSNPKNVSTTCFCGRRGMQRSGQRVAGLPSPRALRRGARKVLAGVCTGGAAGHSAPRARLLLRRGPHMGIVRGRSARTKAHPGLTRGRRGCRI